MGLAGDDDLDGPVLGQQQGLQPLPVAEQQVGPLVGGEAAGEADGEHARVEGLVGPRHLGLAHALGPAGGLEAVADEPHQSLAVQAAHGPQLGVGDRLDGVPAVGAGLLPVGPDASLEQVAHLAGDPGAAVHAVGDRRDGHLVDGEVGPHAREHLAADLAVQLGHAVGLTGEAQRHDRHVEDLAFGLAGLVAQLHELVEGQADLAAPRGEVLLHQLAREAVDAGRHGRVGGEHGAGSDGRLGLGEGEAVVEHEPADALEGEEAGVALVDVEDLGKPVERLEGPHAADAEQDLLADALLDATAVETVGDEADVVGVLVDVGVEQEQRDAADPGLPQAGLHRGAGDVDGDADVGHRDHGHGVGVEAGEALLLPAPDVEALAEVAVVVEEPDAGERQAQLVGRLQVVAGQHAEATRVLGEGGGHAELGGEVADRAQGPVGAVLEPAGGVERAAQLVAHGCRQRDERRVLAELVEVGGGLGGEHAGRVALVVPVLGVDAPEQLLGPLVVDPAEVHHHLPQRGERLGELRGDGERVDGLHGRRT